MYSKINFWKVGFWDDVIGIELIVNNLFIGFFKIYKLDKFVYVIKRVNLKKGVR